MKKIAGAIIFLLCFYAASRLVFAEEDEMIMSADDFVAGESEPIYATDEKIIYSDAKKSKSSPYDYEDRTYQEELDRESVDDPRFHETAMKAVSDLDAERRLDDEM